MTKQQILDVTVRGIREQGKPSGRFIDGGGFECLYRGPRGEKCALGFHIPDDEYFEEIEGLSPSTEFLPWLDPSGDFEDPAELFDFLRELQSCHDDPAMETFQCMQRTSFLGDFEQQIAKLATKHGLRVEPLNK